EGDQRAGEVRHAGDQYHEDEIELALGSERPSKRNHDLARDGQPGAFARHRDEDGDQAIGRHELREGGGHAMTLTRWLSGVGGTGQPPVSLTTGVKSPPQGGFGGLKQKWA